MPACSKRPEPTSCSCPPSRRSTPSPIRGSSTSDSLTRSWRAGATRPGHFNGVAQVVSRLFDIVRPRRAYFGEKDFQQIAVIRAMVEQLGLPIEIVECPIVRGEDGLALSSRNTLLDAPHRAAAPHIYATLRAAVEASHRLTPAELKRWVTEEVERNPLLKVIYYQSVDARTMQEVTTWNDAPRIQGCIAVQAGDIRLIDNIRIR